jgi:hypothetical protein
MAGVAIKVGATAVTAGLLLAIALSASGCDRKNPLFLVPGKEDPPPGTANTPQQTPKARPDAPAGRAGSPAP